MLIKAYADVANKTHVGNTNMLTPNVELKNKVILVIGAAGFIGSNMVMELLRTVEQVTVIGLENMNDYYDVALKDFRLPQIEKLRSRLRRATESLT